MTKILTKADRMLLRATTAEETKKALEAGADVNARDEDGETALMCAITPEQTKLLIAAGADVNARSEYGDTALICALTDEQAILLIDAGATFERGDMAIANDRHKSESAGIELRLLFQKRKEAQKRKNNKTKQRLKSKPRDKKLSGVVFADAIAKMKLSGEIKGDVTPDRAKKIITKMMRDRVLSERNAKK